MDITDSEPCVDILDLSLRAIGEMQLINPLMPYLLGHMERTMGDMLEIIGPNPALQTLMEPTQIPPDGVVSYNIVQQRVIQNTTVNVYRVYEFYECEPGSTGVSNIEKIQNWRTFVNTEPTMIRPFVLSLRQPTLRSMSTANKEAYYWALKLRNTSRTMIPGILKVAKQLKCTQWILPNGDKVPLDAVKAVALEIIPNRHSLIQIYKFIQTGGLLCEEYGNVSVIPTATVDTKFLSEQPFLKVIIRRVLPEGISSLHYVLEAKLPNDGESYIVDPTSMQYGYRGLNGGLIAYGTWEEYEKKFPGKIIGRFEKPLYPTGRSMDNKEVFNLTTIEDEMFFLGEGPMKLITRLTNNCLKYYAQRHCAYCGWIEGEHPVNPKEALRYDFKAVMLLNCGRCKAVGYCDQMCQKAHWKAHKTDCTSKTRGD